MLRPAMKRRLAGLMLLAALWAPREGYSFPLPKNPDAKAVLPRDFTSNYDFEGIVRLSNCSGSLIQFEGAKDDDPALVLTNGHCRGGGMPRPGEFIVNEPVSRSIQLLNASRQTAARLTAIEILYATMTDTDITIYKLRETYAEIKGRYGISPWTLASAHLRVGTAVQVISGYWSRGYTCGIEAFSYQLREAEWTFKDSVRYSRPGCEIIGGTSGSPVVASGTRTVIAINNTVNESGERCTLDNPCEVDESGNVTYQKGYGYAQQTFLIYSCVNAAHQFDVSTPGCRLPHLKTLAESR